MTKPWEDAIAAGDLKTLEAILKVGADVDARDRYGQTGLMLAARAGNTDVVRFLVDRGAKLDVTAKFNLSGLMLAILNGHTEIAEVLIMAGANLKVKGKGAPGFHKKTAAVLAAERGFDRIVELIEARE
jgi:ankyrin repeat protein